MNLNMYLNWNYTDKYLYLLKICHIHVHVFTSNLLENKCTTACMHGNWTCWLLWQGWVFFNLTWAVNFILPFWSPFVHLSFHPFKTFYLSYFFSRNTRPISTKLGKEQWKKFLVVQVTNYLYIYCQNLISFSTCFK